MLLASIVTPNRNGGQFLGLTIDSVLSQTGCSVEQIIIDGASTDRSLEVIQSYSDRLAYWVSEPDQGMYDAINKGLLKAKGDIIAYLNSDDYYYPGTLNYVTSYFQSNPHVDLIYGDLDIVDEHGRILFRQSYPSFHLPTFLAMGYATIGQPAAFWRKSLLDKIGLFDNSFKMASDFDFFARAGAAGHIVHVPKTLAAFRIHQGSMTSRQNDVSKQEVAEIHKRYLDPSNWLTNRLRRLQGNAKFKLINASNFPQRALSKLGGLT